MRDDDEIYRLRSRDDDDRGDRAVPPVGASRGAPTVVGRTKTVGTYPTAAGKFYACSVVGVTGAESEGGSGTLTADASATIYAYNLGTAIPASGTDVLLTFVNSRWVFRYD